MVKKAIYRRTFKGYLICTYHNINTRCSGRTKSAHLYKGLKVLERDEFLRWANNCKSFKRLFKEWEAANYDRKLSPSVDRIDTSKGYVLGNMQWITNSENCSKGAASRDKHYRGPSKRKEIFKRQFMRSIERIILVVLMMAAMGLGGWSLLHKEKPVYLNIDRALCDAQL
jgi:hypothetical protein